tara:strand:- start:209 stop:361 length:153 start_codon:yes stop_codon:yes gene_type:complete
LIIAQLTRRFVITGKIDKEKVKRGYNVIYIRIKSSKIDKTPNVHLKYKII